MTPLVTLAWRDLPTGGRTCLLQLNNPPLNLVTTDLLADLRACLNQLQELETVSEVHAVVVYQGQARAFCAGSDMREFRAIAAAPAERKVLLENHILGQLARLPMPVIAAIDGPALGGGFELALACDLRVIGRSSYVGLPECRIGGLASNGSQRLTKLVGPARAKDLMYTGRTLSAEEAYTWGLVNELADDGCALERAIVWAEMIGKNAPLSVRLSKRLIDLAVDLSVDSGVAEAVRAQESIFASADLFEGATAFAEKRMARFTGR